jgi:phage FluMu gp28-like protein
MHFSLFLLVPTNLRGKKGRVILDEFAFHPEPMQLMKAAIAPAGYLWLDIAFALI